MNDATRTHDMAPLDALQEENQRLRAELEEAQETLRAIREGEVDAIVVAGKQGERVFSLTGAEHVYRLIVQTMQEAALTVTPEGTILSCNPQFETLIHFTAGWVIGRPLEAFVVPEERAKLAGLLAHSQVAPARERLVFRTTDGAPVPAHVSAHVFQQPEGASICLVATDLTTLESSLETLRQLREQEEMLRESEAEFRAFFDTGAVGTAELGLDGRFMRVNDRYCRITGFSRKELLGMTPADLAPPEDRPGDQAQLTAYLQGQRAVFHVEKRYVRKDGRVIWVQVTAAPIRDADGRILRSAGIIQEITSRKEAEAALHSAHIQLERRVEERTRALTEALAKQAAQSEQLRTLTGELALAEERERRRLGRLLHDGLQQVLAAARMWIHLLERSRVELQEGCRETNALLEEAIQSCRSLSAELSTPILHTGGFVPALRWLAEWMADRHRLTVTVQADPGVQVEAEAPRVLLFQAVRELLFNVVKHAEVDQARVEVAEQEGCIQIRVADQGKGFHPDQLGASGSSGLGLPSVRERLEFLGGRLEIASTPGQGSQFTLSMPLGQGKILRALLHVPPDCSAAAPSTPPQVD